MTDITIVATNIPY